MIKTYTKKSQEYMPEKFIEQKQKKIAQNCFGSRTWIHKKTFSHQVKTHYFMKQNINKKIDIKQRQFPTTVTKTHFFTKENYLET